MDFSKFNRHTPGYLPEVHGAPRATDLPQAAMVTKVTAEGAWFTLLSEPVTPYGPAPWGLGSYATRAAAITAGYKPLVGDYALVVFAGTEISLPVLLAWWR